MSEQAMIQEAKRKVKAIPMIVGEFTDLEGQPVGVIFSAN